MMNRTNKEYLWTSDEISKVLDVPWNREWKASGVSIDSRSIETGDLFVAIEGPNYDGHDFVRQAFEAGAAAAIVNAQFNCQGDHLVKVEDTRKALNELAFYSRQRSQGQIIGVTGSVGKTGTKEMLRVALTDQGEVTATKGNLNNHWGLPLSLMRMPAHTDFGIFEMGMSKRGEIGYLSRMASPHVAIITAVEDVHCEFFESIEEIASAKAEIAAGLVNRGIIILNRDAKTFDFLTSTLKKEGVDEIRTFGFHEQSHFRVLDVSRHNEFTQVSAKIDGKTLCFDLRLHGRHWASNALGVLAAVSAVGGDVEAALLSLKDVCGIKGRGKTENISANGRSFTLIDESYNASPVSMRAALEVLGETPLKEGGRRIAVLGDMLELGRQTMAFHEGLEQSLQSNAIDLVFLSGKRMASLWNILPAEIRGHYEKEVKQLAPIVISQIRAGDVIMVKGSLGSNIGNIVLNIKKHFRISKH